MTPAALATQAFLHAHGLDVDPIALDAVVREAVGEYRTVLYPFGAPPGLTDAEVTLLSESGLDPVPRELGRDDPLARSAADHAAILESAFGTGEVARHLGVTDARIRQRLKEGSLYGRYSAGVWRVPSFQFTAEGELPGWSAVARHVPRDLNPVALLRWLTLPNDDLRVGPADDAVSPREWLLAGGAPEAVVAATGGLQPVA